MVRVSQELAGDDGIVYLQLSDGRGWVFEKKPDVGTLFVRQEEGEMDDQGRYFVNYSPELFLPLLDHLGMCETEGAEALAPPRGPEGARAEFEAMLRALGIAPTVRCTRHLEAPGALPEAAGWWARGLAFELCARTHALAVLAVEVGAVVPGGGLALACQALTHAGPSEPASPSWEVLGSAALPHRRTGRLELARPLVVRAGVPRLLYLLTEAAVGGGVIFGAPCAAGVSVQNEDLQVFAGRFSTDRDDFSSGAFYPFSGRLEYSMLE